MTTVLADLPTACPAPPADRAVKFHLSLNVAELERSIAFFRALFGREPAKCRPDYAKFELDEPPVVLSLEPHAPTAGGALNHLGFRLGSSAELVEWQRRLEMAGIATQREEGVECCYARQTKFWVRDPDQNLWEVYVLEEDLDRRGPGQTPEQLPSVAGPAKAVWQHLLGTPLPARIYAPDASTAVVHLRGSFNSPHTAEARRQFLAEVHRILEPGGTAHLHILTGERAVEMPRGTLPGPASYVTYVPDREELIADLAGTGFAGARLTKLPERPCFVHEGMELRETMIEVAKSAS
jgi:catechol 2,3-dioxygenase-like lactoylglutathione lyase family enzyme